MDRPSLFPVDSKLLYYIRSPAGDRFEVYNIINWYEASQANPRHSFRPRCRHLASLDRSTCKLHGGGKSELRPFSEAQHGFDARCEPSTYELHYDSKLGVWHLLESQRPGDGGRPCILVGRPTWSLGETYEDTGLRYYNQSLDQHSSLHYARMDCWQLPRLYDWGRIHESLCIRLRGEEEEARRVSY